MQCCGKLLTDSFETYKTSQRIVNPEFERKFDVQNSYFGGGYIFAQTQDLQIFKKFNMSQMNP